MTLFTIGELRGHPILNSRCQSGLGTCYWHSVELLPTTAFMHSLWPAGVDSEVGRLIMGIPETCF
jgi:hypothetical protein